MGRRIAAATTTVLTSLLIAYSSTAIYRDTFRDVAPDPQDTACDMGLRALHGRYAEALQTSEAPPDLTSLDRRLEGLRGVCEREGEGGHDAWRRLERWRYRADAHRAFGRSLLDDDARAALAYQSPGSSR